MKTLLYLFIYDIHAIRLQICKELLRRTKVEVTDCFFTNFQNFDYVEPIERSEIPKKGEHPT